MQRDWRHMTPPEIAVAASSAHAAAAKHVEGRPCHEAFITPYGFCGSDFFRCVLQQRRWTWYLCSDNFIGSGFGQCGTDHHAIGTRLGGGDSKERHSHTRSTACRCL